MTVGIQDDFDLEKIRQSGQCFRIRTFDDGSYRFITGREVLYIRQADGNLYEVSCCEENWNAIWKPYFSLDSDYRSIRERSAGKNPFIDRAMEESAGLRVLKQDPWEMLVTFIISQRKSIPAIAGSVEMLAEKYGSRIITDRETVYAFPTAEEMEHASIEELQNCSLGYRSKYVLDAVRKVNSGELDLDAISNLDDDALFDALQAVFGVGKKVANCICLFGYGRTGRAPVDVWIQRAIDEGCGGVNPFEQFGENAGIIQQYMFFYQRNRKDSDESEPAGQTDHQVPA